MGFNSTMGSHGSGFFRHPITFTQQLKTGQGDRGQDVYTVTIIDSVFAAVESLAGRKQELARQIVPSATHQVTCRYLPNITPNCRITFGVRTFNIGGVRNVNEGNFELVCLCTEEINGNL